jgi:hypothetical protein
MHSEGFRLEYRDTLRYRVAYVSWYNAANRFSSDSVRLVVCVRRLRCVAEFAT